MSIICNNLIIGKKEEPVRKAPQPNPNTIENLSTIERPIDNTELITKKNKTNPSSHINFHKGYHTVKDGELHKLINAKSDYLKDMMDL